MSIILCNVNLFDSYQPVFVYNPDGSSKLITYVDTDELPEGLASICYDNDSTELRLIGPADYCNTVAQKIGEIDSSKYSNMTLNIEVNP